MDNLICIPSDTSLLTLVALGKKLEEVLQEQFRVYDPTVCWKLLDNELTMQILIRIENSGILFGKIGFSSDVFGESASSYLLRFYTSLPSNPFINSEEKLLEWAAIEKGVADYVLKKMVKSK